MGEITSQRESASISNISSVPIWSLAEQAEARNRHGEAKGTAGVTGLASYHREYEERMRSYWL